MRGVTPDFHIVEEFVRLVPIKGRTTGFDIFNAVKNVLEEFNLNLENIFGVTTDGAPAIRVLSRRALEARNFETKYF